ncbi:MULTISPECIES: CRISPR-associated protein [unclassified Nostoc]|uniref:CRISPR-associated protein n=1 Tax=unclassified Nostoc TaxID=2593658 RepID=UPI000B959FB8|nr:CRISPR-associated protein [Nostoc sp. 'Peltigera membranacea cyanobiont' 232]OYE01594.1 CRISPR-associated protein [Nostoc sp. 'Peltigera membranacea cyanobiont' 232]
MKNYFFQAAKIFFNPETLVPFIIGTIFLSVLGNALTQILFNVFGTTTTAAVGIALGSVLIFMFSVWFLAKSLSKVRSPEIDLGKLPPKKHKGLMLLVSRHEPCKKAIEYHLPELEYCWLICSSQSLDLAKKLKQDFPTLKIAEPIVVNDIYDPLEFYQVVKKIYKNLPPGWTIEDAIADFTGMTAQGSVGMVLASLSVQSLLQYTPAEFKDGQPTGYSLNPIEITLKEQFRRGKN